MSVENACPSLLSDVPAVYAGLAQARNTIERSAGEIKEERVRPTTAQLTDTVHRYSQSQARKAHLSETPNTCCDHFE